MNIALKDVNYQEHYFLFQSNNGETFKVSFDYIKDLNKYITKEGDFELIQFSYVNNPTDGFYNTIQEVSKQQNLEYGLDESGMTTGTEYDE